MGENVCFVRTKHVVFKNCMFAAFIRINFAWIRTHNAVLLKTKTTGRKCGPNFLTDPLQEQGR